MANLKISQLPEALPFQDSDLMPVVQARGSEVVTRKTTVRSLRSGVISDRIISNDGTQKIISDDFGLRGLVSTYYYTFEFDDNKSILYPPGQRTSNTSRERLLSFDKTTNQFVLGETLGRNNFVANVDYKNNYFQMKPFGYTSIFEVRHSTTSNQMRVGMGQNGQYAVEQTEHMNSGYSSWSTRINDARYSTTFVGSEEYENQTASYLNSYLRVYGSDVISAHYDRRNSQNSYTLLCFMGSERLRAGYDRTRICGNQYNTFMELTGQEINASINGSLFLRSYNTGTQFGTTLYNPGANAHQIALNSDGTTGFSFSTGSKNFTVAGFDATGGSPKIRIVANGQNYYIPLAI